MRIESTVIALDPQMKIIAPVRGWQMGREEEIAYAREHEVIFEPLLRLHGLVREICVAVTHEVGAFG